MADELNQYFLMVCDRLRSEITSVELPPCQYIRENLTNSMFVFPITARECYRTIYRLKVTGCGSKAFSSKLLKSLCNEMWPRSFRI